MQVGACLTISLSTTTTTPKTWLNDLVLLKLRFTKNQGHTPSSKSGKFERGLEIGN